MPLLDAASLAGTHAMPLANQMPEKVTRGRTVGTPLGVLSTQPRLEMAPTR